MLQDGPAIVVLDVDEHNTRDVYFALQGNNFETIHGVVCYSRKVILALRNVRMFSFFAIIMAIRLLNC